jgi:hypothetical protein
MISAVIETLPLLLAHASFDASRAQGLARDLAINAETKTARRDTEGLTGTPLSFFKVKTVQD